ncbi:CRAL/TRIO domain protein [Xylaria sp. FL0064]|nr:CRAL/TRIO domain protein [Xylaria sp. FL0064]
MENGQCYGSTVEEPRASKKENGELSGFTTELTAHEQQCFQSFVQQCRELGLLERPTGLSAEDTLDGLQDEAALLRFLRFGTPPIRAKHIIALILMTLNTCAALCYPHWSGHITKRGLPICLFDVANLDGANLAKYRSYSASQITCRALTSLDYLTRFALPLCAIMAADRRRKPVSGAVYLADIASLTLRQAWNIRGYAQSITGLLATCYPEVVDTIYVLNAPPYFPRIWSFLKAWFDPRTAEKLVIVPPANILSTLLKEIDIECIPERYGGQARDEHGIVPLVGGLKELLGVEELPEGPIKWTMHQGKRTAIAVGTWEGKARREVVGPVGIKATL